MTAIATIRTGIPLPKTATRTAARAMPGKAMTTSSTRMTDSSIARCDVAARPPRTAPATRARKVAPRPIRSEYREPWTTRAKMSRPARSVPNQWSAPGGWAGVPVASGSWANRGPASATTQIASTDTSAILAEAGRRRPRAGLESPVSLDVSRGRTRSHLSDPWVDDDVKEVDDEVDDEEGGGNGEHGALDQGDVGVGDAGEQELAHPRQVEDGLDHHGSPERVGESPAQDRQRCDQRVAERGPEHESLGQSVASGGA